MKRARRIKTGRCTALGITCAAMIGCAGGVHTLDSTKNLNRSELADLCADLEIRANQDCRWNMQERQSSVTNQQTWEINCRARRDSARQSFDNACHPARFREDDQDSAPN